MTTVVLLFLLAQTTEDRPLSELLRSIEQSGRVLTLARTLDEGMRIAPGAPPLLAFRFIEGQERGRFKGLDLVLDDAGH